MPLPICERCAKAPVLCASCERRLSEGAINEYDVEVSRALFQIFGNDADFARAVDTEGHVIVIVKGNDVGRVIGKGGANLKILSERLCKAVKVIGQDSFEEMVTALAAPARIEGINTVVKSGGLMKTRVRLKSAEAPRLRMKPEEFKRLVVAISEREVEVVFD